MKTTERPEKSGDGHLRVTTSKQRPTTAPTDLESVRRRCVVNVHNRGHRAEPNLRSDTDKCCAQTFQDGARGVQLKPEVARARNDLCQYLGAATETCHLIEQTANLSDAHRAGESDFC